MMAVLPNVARREKKRREFRQRRPNGAFRRFHMPGFLPDGNGRKSFSHALPSAAITAACSRAESISIVSTVMMQCRFLS